jgi:polysaccharide deacetylase 2 family uncharacterized protein YibQ
VVADDLSTPLGQGDRKKRTFVVPVIVGRAVAAVLALVLVFFGLWVALFDDPFGGEPVVIVATDLNRAAAPAKGEPAGAPSPPGKKDTPSVADAHGAPDKGGPGQKTVTIIDGTSGKREEVVVGQSAPAAPGGPPAGATVEQRISETTRHGLIPRIASDGTRPADVYARAMKPADKTDKPRIAIVVEGLGISATTTAEAISRLPGGVTLGFIPYGGDLERLVSRARSEGHEILLQVPMEPFDYPDNDPGPQTLLIALSADQNIDRLHWFMSRFQGYVGVANYMGGRFTATEQSVAPILRDSGKRGLIYFEDGASARSVTGQLSGANGVAYARADLILDQVPTPAEIDATLARLEALARERGVAVAAASALPVTIERLAQWAKAVEARGFALAPITAVASKPKSS